jgi:hypothetical protein
MHILVKDFKTETRVGGWRVTGYQILVRQGRTHFAQIAMFPVYLGRDITGTPYVSAREAAMNFAYSLSHNVEVAL